MNIRSKKDPQELLNFICPFCKTKIKSSSKTEIFYRNMWIAGCYNCFGLSINAATSGRFQQKEYQL